MRRDGKQKWSTAWHYIVLLSLLFILIFDTRRLPCMYKSCRDWLSSKRVSLSDVDISFRYAFSILLLVSWYTAPLMHVRDHLGQDGKKHYLTCPSPLSSWKHRIRLKDETCQMKRDNRLQYCIFGPVFWPAHDCQENLGQFKDPPDGLFRDIDMSPESWQVHVGTP